MINLHNFRARPRKNCPPFPSAQCVDYLASPQAVAEYGARVASCIYAYDAENVGIFVETEEEFCSFGRLLVERMLSDRNWLNDLVAWSESELNSLRDFARQKLAIATLEGVENQELAVRFEKFHEAYRNYHLKNTPSWWVGAESLQAELENRLRDAIKEPDQVIRILNELSVAQEYQTEQSKEEEDFLCLAQKFRSAGITDPSSAESKLSQQVSFHASEYSSIPFGYNTGVLWDEEYYQDKLKKLLADPEYDPGTILDNLLVEKRLKLDERRRLEDSLNLSEDVRYLFTCLRQLGYLQDLKKTTQVRSHPILVLETRPEIAKRLNLESSLLEYMDFPEVADLLRKGTVGDGMKREVAKRLSSPAVVKMQDSKTRWLTDEEAVAFMREYVEVGDKQITEIKGSVANPGFAHGFVRVMHYSTELSKVQEGDILVTAMTTPDFVPAMKKASAIVTDEGGVTCHAAIVSREMSKPCIIGTKIATKVLHDGDEVEVDADKGIVRIIKRA